MKRVKVTLRRSFIHESKSFLEMKLLFLLKFFLAEAFAYDIIAFYIIEKWLFVFARWMALTSCSPITLSSSDF